MESPEPRVSRYQPLARQFNALSAHHATLDVESGRFETAHHGPNQVGNRNRNRDPNY